MLSASLPDFPWDQLEPAKAVAAAHPDGIVDLSVGTPVDPVPAPVQNALAAAADAPGYPQTAGTPALRAAITAWLARECGTTGSPAVLPTIGSKELVAWLPTLLGVGPGDVVVIPRVCYPTYEAGVRLAGAEVVRSDSLTALGPDPRVKLIWINSPSNPTGKVLPPAHLRKVVDWARERGAVVAADECYLSLGWEETPVSVLSDEVCGGDHTGVLAVHSLSKRSNLAGFRAGFVAGDPAVVAELLAVRKHAGMIVPAPVQAAMIAALGDESHVAAQRDRYAARRAALRAALTGAGFTIEHSGAGLYLWSTRGEDCWKTVDWLAERGILAAPGAFYGPAAAQHVRVALTATDERVAAAVARLA
ncbi:succinyldiaminopimelate transaminase [Couchioplanes caeruleus]|uniref:Aminotransferase n=1 Tax=Couchioplanes caeruleus TaxID=56438 RepID=A0A3N1GP62_9ACTN|nr:succinyldiaminopimelate transaminase [Couchioplanes caeruleus]ROP32035.1 succinyldiaminopimelate aminotransferase [Couchioplanes caeruleus]